MAKSETAAVVRTTGPDNTVPARLPVPEGVTSQPPAVGLLIGNPPAISAELWHVQVEIGTWKWANQAEAPHA
jgi:hypothetical protein